MNAAIHAWFDEDLDHAIRLFQVELQVNGSCAKPPHALRPHLTLSVCRDLDVDTFCTNMKPMARTLKPFPVTFDSLGLFPDPVSAAFLNPVPTHALLMLHRAVAEILADMNCRLEHAQYFPNEWTPHCTLAVELNDAGLKDILQFQRPVKGYITRIGIVEYPTDAESAIIPLGDGA